MSNYFIGDIHGCYDSLKLILKKINFNPDKDHLWLTGDLVAKGPKSLEVIHLIRQLGNNVRIVLGNHDLHLLAIHAGISKNKPEYRINKLLNSPNIGDIINWIRKQPILQIDQKKKILMSHAGIHPKWNINFTIQYANEIEKILRSNNYQLLLNAIYGKISKIQKTKYNKLMHLIYNITVFTRMRLCYQNGVLNMFYKHFPLKINKQLYPSHFFPLQPWFNLPNMLPPCYTVIFGHWSNLMGKKTPRKIYGIDHGCYYSGTLIALQWENKKIIKTFLINN